MFAPGMLMELAACAIGVCILFAVAFVLVVQGEQEENPMEGLPDRPPQLLTDAQRGTEWGKILQQKLDGVFYAQSSCRDVLWFHRVEMMDVMQVLKRDVDELLQSKKSADVQKDLERISARYEQQARDRARRVLGRCPDDATIQYGRPVGAEKVADARAGRSTNMLEMVRSLVQTHVYAYAGAMQGNMARYSW